MRLLASTIGTLLLGCSILAVPAFAADENYTTSQTVLGAILKGIGLQNGDDNGIDYHERPPLVIPPTKTLPTPEKADAVTANPAWPKDPDVKRRREAAKRERDRNISDEREREQNPLRPDQMTPGGVGSTGPRKDDGYRAPADGFAGPLSPSQLGYKAGGLFKKAFGSADEERVRFTGEPTRTDLTAPPPGYQTPSPAQPYGPGGPEPAKATNDYVERGELKSGR